MRIEHPEIRADVLMFDSIDRELGSKSPQEKGGEGVQLTCVGADGMGAGLALVREHGKEFPDKPCGDRFCGGFRREIRDGHRASRFARG